MGKHLEVCLKQRTLATLWAFQSKAALQNSSEVFKGEFHLVGVVIPKNLESADEYFEIVPER